MALKVNRICSEIIEKVSTSNLDFKMNQTHYSLHFSIRKKFSKTTAEEEVNQPLRGNVSEDFSQNNMLRQELLNMRNEYEKLFKFYELEMGLRSNLETELEKQNEQSSKLKLELSRANEALGLKDHLEKESKKVKADILIYKANSENRCIEIKNEKVEMENIKKDKNSLSVALKGSRKENKELSKSFDRERETFVKKISELTEFKSRKLNEERAEKFIKRKEMKKSRQLEKKDNTKILTDKNFNKTPKNEGREEQIEQIEPFELDPGAESTETKTVAEKKQENIGEVEAEDLVEDEKLREATHSVEINEYDEGFIGPKLPRRMTQAEIKEFYEEMMAKFKFPS